MCLHACVCGHELLVVEILSGLHQKKRPHRLWHCITIITSYSKEPVSNRPKENDSTDVSVCSVCVCPLVLQKALKRSVL